MDLEAFVQVEVEGAGHVSIDVMWQAAGVPT
jgi:hypothetical protein